MVPVGARGGGVVGKRTARSSLLLVLVVQGASKRTGSVHEHRAVVTEERTAIDARRVGTGGGLAREERVGELVEVALNEARAICAKGVRFCVTCGACAATRPSRRPRPSKTASGAGRMISDDDEDDDGDGEEEEDGRRDK